jgi:AcrR family transcriptional regulator
MALTREKVLKTALELADRDGVEALTMRKLAEALGVEAMSLYYHVKNKEEILDGMVDLIFEEIDLPVGRVGWRTAMRRRAVSARNVLRKHPWAIGRLESRRNPGLATLRHHDAVLGVLRKGGFSVADAAHAFSLLDSYIYGFAMQEQNLPFQDAAQLAQMADEIVPQLEAAGLMHMKELVEKHALKPGYAYADEFELGLDLILDGLSRLL